MTAQWAPYRTDLVPMFMMSLRLLGQFTRCAPGSTGWQPVVGPPNSAHGLSFSLPVSHPVLVCRHCLIPHPDKRRQPRPSNVRSPTISFLMLGLQSDLADAGGKTGYS